MFTQGQETFLGRGYRTTSRAQRDHNPDFVAFWCCTRSEKRERWDEMRWDEMRWDEMRWDEMRWDEMKWVHYPSVSPRRILSVSRCQPPPSQNEDLHRGPDLGQQMTYQISKCHWKKFGVTRSLPLPPTEPFHGGRQGHTKRGCLALWLVDDGNDWFLGLDVHRIKQWSGEDRKWKE